MANSGILESWGYYASSNKTTSKWVFSWTSEKIEAGKTKISWTLKATGRKYPNDRLWTRCELYINEEQKFYINNYVYYRDEIHASGDFDIEHTNEQQVSFTVQLNVPHIFRDWNSNDNKTNPITETFYVDANPPYTKCYWDVGANVTISGAYIAPGSSVIVKWSGAQPGINNKIAGYRVRLGLKAGDDIVWNNKDEAMPAANAVECEIDPWEIFSREDSRGKEMVAEVTIIGEINGYNSEPKQNSSQAFVNRLPKSPTLLSGESVTIKHNISSFTPSVITGSDDDNQVIQLYYSETEGEKIKFENSTSFEILEMGASKTVKFYSYDGLEYSASTDLTITRNTNLTFEYSLDNIEESFAISDFNKQGNLTITFTTDKKSVSKQIEVTKNFEEREYNYREFLKVIASEEQLQSVSILFDDGIEEFTLPDISVKHAFPKFTIKNSLQDSSTLSNYCGNIVKWREGESIWKDISVENKEEGEVIKQIDTNEGYSIISDNDLTKIKTLRLDFGKNITHHPYTDILSLSSRIEGGGLDPYGNPGPFKFQLEDGQCISYDTDFSTSNDTIAFSISGENAYDIATKPESKEHLEGSLALSYSYINAFGENVTVETATMMSLDWSASVHLTAETETELKLEDQYGYFMEKMTPSFYYDLASFTTPECYLEKSLDGQIWTYFTKVSVDEGVGTEKTYSFNTNTGLYTYSLSIEIPSISVSETCQLRLVAITGTARAEFQVYNSETSNTQFILKRFTTPLIQFTDVKYEVENDNKKFVAKYKVTDWGVDKIEGNSSFTIDGQIRDGGILSNGSIVLDTNDTGEVSFAYSTTDSWNTLYIAPILKATWTDRGFLIDKSTKEPIYLICYNIAPTVAYRQNHIGINTNQIDDNEDAVVIISQYNDRKKIIFSGADIKDGVLNLGTMGLSGFIIDCGTWDESGGGTLLPPAIQTNTNITLTDENGERFSVNQLDFSLEI